MKTRITDAKIACLDINLQKERMKLGVHITIDDPEQLEKIREREAGIVTERIEMISEGWRQRHHDHKGHRRPLPQALR